MLGLKLRKEFQGKRLKGTAIELRNDHNTGATQISASEFLEITYPSHDVLKAIEYIGPDQGRPVVLIGDRGFGKSHLLAALYHTLTDKKASQQWLSEWAPRIKNPKVASLPLRDGMLVISESLQRQEYKFLWDILLEQHPHGSYIRGKWEAEGTKKTDVLPASLVMEMLKKQPMALLLDEYQTWYDGLTNTKQYPWKTWAFNFIQILSEIAKEHPDLLLLVVSVRDGSTDAYQQIHRVHPVQVDFKGPHAAQDRRSLLLHRLFENRIHIPSGEIEKLIGTHISEYFRLGEVPSMERDRKKDEFLELWPFAPHLMQLLEDQVLVATSAQETRDLIRILADLFKTHGKDEPILTASDFLLDDESSGIAALLDSVSNKHHSALREKAQRNLKAVQEAVATHKNTVPHLSELVSALWLRSLAVDKFAGAEPATLHIDITKKTSIDDNAFQVEMATIIDNSFNIHQYADRLIFREEENPQAKLMSSARNDRLFTDGSDHRRLAKEVRYVVGGADDVPRDFCIVVLQQKWLTDPWTDHEEETQPANWGDRFPIVVLPEEPDKLQERIGAWLKDHLQNRRNTIRFLLPKQGSTNMYTDRDLIVLARAVLKANEWKAQSGEYAELMTKYRRELHSIIKQRFDRFTVLRVWNNNNPSRCQFQIEPLAKLGSQAPEAIENTIKNDVFVPEDFEKLVLVAAQNTDSLGKLLGELKEPRPNEETCIPWLGETIMKEKIVRFCAKGQIAINLRGTEYLQAKAGEGEDAAIIRLKNKLSQCTGKHLNETFLLMPQAVPQTQTVTIQGIGLPIVSVISGSETEQTGIALIGGDIITTPGSSIFGPESDGKKNTAFHAPINSSLNLLAEIEKWGIGPGSTVQEIVVKIDSATGSQLQKLIRTLPDGMKYDLSLQKKEER